MMTIKSSLKFLTGKKIVSKPKATRLLQPLVGVTAHEHFIFFFRNDF